MIMAIINDSDVKEVTSAMTNGGFSITRIGSSGGFLRGGMTTVISVMHEEAKGRALDILKKATHARKYGSHEPVIDTGMLTKSFPAEIVVGGATVFILNVEESHKF
jgi:uncharacterized protein YaaQ